MLGEDYDLAAAVWDYFEKPEAGPEGAARFQKLKEGLAKEGR